MTRRDTMLFYIADHPWRTAWQISRGTEISASSVSAMLARMRSNKVKVVIHLARHPQPQCPECGSVHNGMVYAMPGTEHPK